MAGRIDIAEGTAAPFALYAEGGAPPPGAAKPGCASATAFADAATRGVHAPDQLARLYFSDANVEALQVGLRNLVYARSSGRHVIGRQSDAELRTIMRSIYLQNASHRGFEVLEEVRALNGRVLDYAVPRVLAELEAYTQYRRDVSAAPSLLTPAASTNVKGERSLEMMRASPF